jgi:ribonuclease D
MTIENFQVCDRDLDDTTLTRYLEAESIAIDTETMGLIPRRDRLCLIQLCDPQGYVTAIRVAQGQTEAPNLKQLMEATKITKVFHFARFDVAQLLCTFGIQTQPIFCTKIASKLVRTYSGSHGLRSLVIELEGIELDKTAANDVRYLISLRDKLTMMLKREERWDLAERCFECLPVFVSLDLLQYPNVFEH